MFSQIKGKFTIAKQGKLIFCSKQKMLGGVIGVFWMKNSKNTVAFSTAFSLLT